MSDTVLVLVVIKYSSKSSTQVLVTYEDHQVTVLSLILALWVAQTAAHD